MNERISSWILFLINPFISMILVFMDYSKPYAKNIFWAFCVFYGFTFAIGNESLGSDINRYIDQFHFLYDQRTFSISDIIAFFITSGEIDIFNIFLTYLVSRVSDSREILTLVYGIFFGFFYSRNIWYTLSLLEGKLSFSIKLLLFTLILVVPVWFINGIRMYLAFHVFMYGLLPYIFENKKEKLNYVYLTWLIHFSFLIPIGIFIIYRLIGNRLNLYFFAFILSIFSAQIELQPLNNTIENILPQRLVERSIGYTDQEVLEAKKTLSLAQPKNWYVKWYSLSLRWALYFLIGYIFFKGSEYVKRNTEWRRLYSITLIFFIAANILLGMPSGGRFMLFPIFLSLIFIILYLDEFKIDLNFKMIVQILTPVFLLFILVSIRIGLYSLSITTILGNPLIALFNTGETLSLNDLIK